MLFNIYELYNYSFFIDIFNRTYAGEPPQTLFIVDVYRPKQRFIVETGFRVRKSYLRSKYYAFRNAKKLVCFSNYK